MAGPLASKTAHQSLGWAAGVIAAALVTEAGAAGHYHEWSVLAFLMAYSGGTAPDWLEIAWWVRGRGRHSWLAHRTWTHWGVAWCALLILSYAALSTWPWMAMAFGFAAGGMMHLLADWPNPLGVPWLFVYRRHSLKWWNSGRCDWLIVGAAWAYALAQADSTWFNGRGLHHLLGLATV